MYSNFIESCFNGDDLNFDTTALFPRDRVRGGRGYRAPELRPAADH
ncbi:hypothetical protein [Rhodococcus sp. 14-2470-1a]|nr:MULTISPECIES: hypothetical protein [unclassified Rhodococcus (in: high G+C Gram-positive bacteria)]